MGACCNVAGRVPARVLLGIMAFLMFLVTQMIRSNLYIAIVAMTDVSNVTLAEPLSPTLAWDEGTKGLLLGAFYWSYWITELPGGMLAQRYGGRNVLGISVLVAGLLNLALPAGCRFHYWAAAGLRTLQGLALGVTWPAMHCLSAHWIPATERSKFMVSYHGASIGTALTYPLSGLVIVGLGWDYVFYLTGALTLMWCVAWWYLVYDSPTEHPRLSRTEQKYLERNLPKNMSPKEGTSLRTPWIAIITSPPFWAVLIATQGRMWGTLTLSMQLPSYFDSVHALDIRTNGFVSGFPEICRFLFGLMFSYMIDYLLSKEYLSLTKARKISVATCEYIPAVLLLLLAYLGADSTAGAVTLLAMSCAVGGASSSGGLANIVDLSPNFAGIILGLIKTLCMIPGVLSPFVVSQLTDQGTVNWRYVFILAAAIYAFCCTVFLALGSGKVQSWNDVPASSLNNAHLQESAVMCRLTETNPAPSANNPQTVV